VTGFLERTPCLEFLGRLSGTDLVGEKLDGSAVSEILSALESIHPVRCITLFAVEGEAPGYCLLAEGSADLQANLSQTLESELTRHHHYLLARELGQLAPVRTLLVPEASVLLSRRAECLGLSLGEAKVEALQTWRLPISPERLATGG
jgi:hypothetical protein